jgi:hypothetical protein
MRVCRLRGGNSNLLVLCGKILVERSRKRMGGERTVCRRPLKDHHRCRCLAGVGALAVARHGSWLGLRRENISY